MGAGREVAMRIYSMLTAIMLCFALCTPGDEKTPLRPEDVVAFSSVSSPEINPDGSLALYVKTVVDLESSTYKRTIWLADLSRECEKQFTNSLGDNTSPRWSPRGDLVAFISTRPYLSGGRETRGRLLWLISAAGGEAWLPAELEEGVNDFRWSPDGKQIFILSTEGPSEEAEKERAAKAKRKDDAVVVDAELFRDRFWVLDVADGSLKKIADCHPGIDDFEVSPSAQRIVYSTNYTGKMDDDQKFDLWLVDTATGATSRLTDFPGPETSPVWSPDSKRVAYISTTGPDIEYAQTDISIIDAVPGSTPEMVTGDFDRSILRLAWADDGTIFCTAAMGVDTPLYRIYLQKDAVKMELMSSDGLGVNSFSLDRGPRRALMLADGFPRLADVYLLDLRAGNLRQVTDMTAQLEPFRLAEQMVIKWKTEDGTALEGVLALPVDYKKGQLVPLILHCHGGPYGRVRNTFYNSWQVYAAAGFAVIAPNYRGSVGYGDAFGRALEKDFGGVDYRDCLSGVDAVIKKGVADPERLGVTGGSWGGYLTNWTISQTDRFKAAVSMFGIFSLFTDMSNSIQSGFEKMYFGDYYWDDKTLYVERAPQTYVKDINTPVLLLHGEEDTLTNIANSREMYTALRLLGKTVQFVVYPREGHGFREPNHQIDSMRRAVEWFDKYLKGNGSGN
jgi:dipeptidyl aminopeptidase/acylaminoacyl peptidase